MDHESDVSMDEEDMEDVDENMVKSSQRKKHEANEKPQAN